MEVELLSPMRLHCRARFGVLNGAAALLALTACRSGAPPPSGAEPASLTWEGAVRHAGAPLEMTIELRSDSTQPTGTIDVRDLYALAYPLQRVRVRGDSVQFELPDGLPPGSFEGVRTRGRIRGTFRGLTESSDSIRGTFELWRRPPRRVPYHAEEVELRNGNVPIDGTLMLPAGPGPHPAVVVLHGSGPQTRDSYVRYFADQFVREGIAAFIYDKRNTRRRPDLPVFLRGGGSFADHAGDALVALRALRRRPEIDADRIGLWGLSQGAWLAPLAASRAPSEIAFIVLVSGGGVTPAEQELYDDEVKLRARGFTDAQVSDALSLLRLADDYVRSGSDADWTEFVGAREAARRQPWYPLLDRFPQILPRDAPAWSGLRTDLDYDPRPILEQLRMPMLAILGDADALTPARETARRIEAALSRAGNRDYRIMLVPGADHAMTMRRAGRATDWRRPVPGWVDEMTAWVLARTKR